MDVAVGHGQRFIPLFAAVAGLGLLANALGYLRETALAVLYGSSEVTDAFFGASFIPNALITILSSGAGTAILVPILVQFRERGDSQARELAMSVLNIAVLTLVGLTVLLMLSSHFWMRALFPGFSPETSALATSLAYILNPTALFLTLAAVLAGTLNTFGRFRSVAVAPCIGNVVIIIGICVSARVGGIRGAAVGVALGALAQLAIMSWMAFSKAVPYRPILNLRHPGLRAFAGMALPTMLYLAVAYVSLTVERAYASGFNVGAFSTLSYAMRLFTLPATVVAGSIATILHTEFSLLADRKETHMLGDSFRRGFDLTVLALIPISIGAIVFSHSIVTVVYGYGRFSAGNVSTTAATFAAYSLGILPLGLTVLCQRLFYALRVPGIPLLIECAALAVYLVTAPALGRLFHLPGLALARSGSFLLVGGLSLILALRRLDSQSRHRQMLGQLTRCTVSVIPTALFWVVLITQLHRIDPVGGHWVQLSALVVACITGSALYLVTARWFGCREADNAIRGVFGRLGALRD